MGLAVTCMLVLSQYSSVTTNVGTQAVRDRNKPRCYVYGIYPGKTVRKIKTVSILQNFSKRFFKRKEVKRKKKRRKEEGRWAVCFFLRKEGFIWLPI